MLSSMHEGVPPLLHVSMTWYIIKHKGSFTFTFTLGTACIDTRISQEDGENCMWFSICWPEGHNLPRDSTVKGTEKVYWCIYPLHYLYIHKVKMLKWLQFEVSELLDMHGDRTCESDGPCAQVYPQC
jgi:hypothetical protein